MQCFSLRSFGISSASFAALLLLIFLPEFAHAAAGNFFGPIISNQCNCDYAISANGQTTPWSAPAWGCILQTIQNLTSLAVTMATVIITIFIAWAGFTYMTSGGSAEKRQLANKRIMNAVIGLLIVLCAYLIVDSLLKVIYDPTNAKDFGPWNSILGPQGQADCLAPVAPPTALPGLSNANASGGGGVAGGTSATPATGTSGTPPAQNSNNSCSATALAPVFGSQAAEMSCVTKYEDGSCNPSAPSGTDKGADGNSVSYGLFQVNISANNLSSYPACEAAVSNQPLNCTQAFSGGAYTASNHQTRVSNQGLYNTCVTAASNPACNEQAAQTILNKQGIGAWGTNAQNNCHT